MAFEKFNLSGKTALITGAAGLLGSEHATALLESGATVVITDISNDNLKNLQESMYKYGSKIIFENDEQNILSEYSDYIINNDPGNADNDTFATEADNILDFSERNPFGDVGR